MVGSGAWWTLWEYFSSYLLLHGLCLSSPRVRRELSITFHILVIKCLSFLLIMNVFSPLTPSHPSPTTHIFIFVPLPGIRASECECVSFRSCA